MLFKKWCPIDASFIKFARAQAALVKLADEGLHRRVTGSDPAEWPDYFARLAAAQKRAKVAFDEMQTLQPLSLSAAEGRTLCEPARADAAAPFAQASGARPEPSDLQAPESVDLLEPRTA